MNEVKKRRTAFKVPIGLLAKGKLEFEQEDKQRFRALFLDGKEIIRINIIANIIDSQSSESYRALTIDDGTGNIRIKAFSDSIALLEKLQVGDTILVIGLLRYFNDELYIIPEIIKSIDPRWLSVRKHELEQEFGTIYNELISINKTARTSSLREEILDLVKTAEAEEGIDVEKIILQLNYPVDEIKKVLKQLLEGGEIFEPKPGRLRLLY